MNEGKELTVRETQDIEFQKAIPLTVDDVVKQVAFIEDVMARVFKNDVHYGIIAEGMKPSLYKAGAEKMAFMFRLRQGVLVVDERPLANGHREFIITTPLMDSKGKTLGYGLGSCSTMESKYRWRKGERKCPSCGQTTIIKGKDFNNTGIDPGWLCWQKKGGCGAKFPSGSPEIESQQVGRVENEDLADLYNTVLKIAKKRSYIDGVITVTGCSDFFTQDVEDLPEDRKEEIRQSAKAKTKTGTADLAPRKESAIDLNNLERVEKIEAIKEALLASKPDGANEKYFLMVQSMKNLKRTWEEFERDADDEMIAKALFDLGVPDTWKE